MSDKEFQSVIESINARFDELEVVIEEGFNDLKHNMDVAFNPPGYKRFPFNPLGYIVIGYIAVYAVYVAISMVI